ncbi:hypothetical protein CFOLD11_02790 [Clostridium folliculivorans]|uniref:HAMP domain-containing protein n=1 Tax=Clostridium folliculivorans TaxID=2886038 RepID=A0A9W5XYW0_9CLOT|nr:histidine kinase [Clostridium folliculivorans]GKU23453.1 hypothetical protein CFOLD11_02790 [Clostridium folliculivorans]
MIDRRKYKNSLVFRITGGTVTVIILLLLVLVTSNVYSLHVVKNNTINSAMNEMRIHINNMNNCFDNAINDLNEIVLGINNQVDLKNGDESTRYFETKRLQDILIERMNISKTTDVYSIYNSSADLLLMSVSSRVTSKEKIELDNIIRKDLLNRRYSVKDLWSPIKLDNKWFFFKMYRFSDNIIVGFIKADTLMALVDLKGGNIDEQIVLTDSLGNSLSKVGNINFTDIPNKLANESEVVNNFDNKYIMVSTRVESSKARLSTLIEEKGVLLGLGYIQWFIAILGIISLILMPYIIYYLNREILRPVKGLVLGTRQVEQGNFEYRVNEEVESLEFNTLIHSFNSMIKEIKTLKISAYEEKLELNKAELRYLQTQIRPHFFLNALTTIHSLAYKDKNEEIREFIDALSNHLRYMFRGGLNKVSIKEEIDRIKDYFYMQEIKFPNSVFYVIDVDQFTEQERIPQLLILTFVENAFKHSMTLEDTLSIFIKTERCIFDGKDSVRIIIEDDGEGFPEDIIKKVNEDSSAYTSDGYRIGITNIKRTLELLYGKDNLLKLSNEEPMGGKVEIVIPLEKGDEIEINNSRR